MNDDATQQSDSPGPDPDTGAEAAMTASERRAAGAAEERGDDIPMPSRRTALSVLGGFAVLAAGGKVFGSDLLHPPATTADGDYKEETIEFLIPLAQGGGTDTWARFVGQELAQVVPGKPGFAPTNEAGGEGITGTNHYVASAKDDGTEVLVSTATTVVPYLLKLGSVQYDFTSLVPILANGTGAVVYARSGANVSGLDDLVDRRTPLKFGGITPTGLDLTTLLAFDLLELDVDTIFGFEGRGPVNLALQRGEVDIDYQTTSTYDSAIKPIVEDGDASVLFCLGQVNSKGEVVRDPNFKDVPTVVEAYEQLHGKRPSGPKLDAYKTVLGITYTYQKALWVPPETPPEAVELLRSSAADLSASKEFNKAAERVLGGYPLDAGTDLRERISEAYTVPPKVREHVVTLLTSTYNATID